MRTTHTILSLLFASALIAQEEPTRVEKSAGIEMEQADPKAEALTAIGQIGVEVMGDLDVAPAPQNCKEKADQQRTDCMYQEVLKAIRGQLNGASTDGSSAYPVVVTFVVNQFGDMKDIKVEHTGSVDLPKKVIVALYGLPKFASATKAGARVGSTVRITYPYDALFASGE